MIARTVDQTRAARSIMIFSGRGQRRPTAGIPRISIDDDSAVIAEPGRRTLVHHALVSRVLSGEMFGMISIS